MKLVERLNLATKFNILTISLILATSVGIAVNVTYREKIKQRQYLESQGRSTATMIAKESEYAIYTENHDDLQRIIKSLSVLEDVSYVVFANQDKHLLERHSFESHVGIPPLRLLRDPLEKGVTIEAFVNEADGQDYIDVLAPVVSLPDPDQSFMFPENEEDEKIIGYVQLGFSQSRMKKSIHEIQYSIFWGAFVLVLLGVVLTLMLTRRIASPIRELAQVAHRISEGDLSQEVRISSHDEISDLSRAFNHMLQRLQHYRYEVDQYQRTLEKKVDERTFELANATEQAYFMAQRADAANQSKSAFLANMSHELRTPLNAVIGFSEVLIDQNFGELNETQLEYLKDILTSGHHLLSLVQDILDLSKIEVGKMEVELSEIAVSSLLKGSLVMIREKAAKHGIQLTVDTEQAPDLIMADERKLKQIVYNLLSNAVKFTPDGGKIDICAAMVERSRLEDDLPAFFRDEVLLLLEEGDGSYLKISVTDTGIGIKPEFMKHIFEPFQQEDSSTARKYGGTGLGLSLCKKLIALHEGGIWVESQVEQGSRFSFVLPLIGTVDQGEAELVNAQQSRTEGKGSE